MDNIIMDSKEYIDKRLEDAYRVLTGKMDAVKTSFEGQMQGLREGVQGQMQGIRSEIQGLRDQYKGLENRMIAIETKMDVVLEKTEEIKTQYTQVIGYLQILMQRTADKKVGFEASKDKENRKE